MKDWDQIRRRRRMHASFMLTEYQSQGPTIRGSSVSYDEDAAALFARMSPDPDTTRKGHINTLVEDLKTAGVWDKLDVLYVLAAHDAQAARLNWKSSSYNLTAVNSPTFTTDRGYAGDDATSYLDLAWDAATNGVNYAQNSACFGVWCRSSGQDASSLMGVGTGAGATSRMNPRDTSDQIAYRINQASTSVVTSITDGAGLVVVNRSAAAATQAYKNGSSVGSGTAASASLETVDFNIGRAAGGFHGGRVAAALAGASLNSTEHAALYTALNTYLTAVGAA